MKVSIAFAATGSTLTALGLALWSIPLALVVVGVALVAFALFREGGV